MKTRLMIAVISLVCICGFGCTKEKKYKDRSDANDMFGRICKLTKDYTVKLTESQDSSTWATTCIEFEDKLEKINFSYPPDTDLLLTEGQNDTIHALMLEYITARDEKIHSILHPIIEIDSIVDSDSLVVPESLPDINQADASRNLDN